MCWQESTHQAPEGLNNSAGVSRTSPTLSCLVCSELTRVKYNKGWQISHAAQPSHCGTELITTIKHERAFFNLIMGYYGYTVGTRHSQGWAASLHNQIILTGTAAFTKDVDSTEQHNARTVVLKACDSPNCLIAVAWYSVLRLKVDQTDDASKYKRRKYAKAQTDDASDNKCENDARWETSELFFWIITSQKSVMKQRKALICLI